MDDDRLWNDFQISGDLPREDLASWEAEFNRSMNSQREDLEHDYGDAMQQAWTDGIGDFHEDGFTEGVKFDVDGLPVLGEYVFGTCQFYSHFVFLTDSSVDQNNKYLGSTHSPLSEAKALLEQNGSLSEAALLLEAAIQKGELGEGGYEAWILLGDTRTMDEREDAGMRALAEGVRIAEAAGAAAGMLVGIVVPSFSQILSEPMPVPGYIIYKRVI